VTEFDYDCYRKKNVAHSAARRKGGSKSKKCSLPSDRMTQKQWNERCGQVMSYSIGKPMTWAEFSKLPKDLKEEYMNNLIEKYNANARTMAEVFGVSVATVFRVVKNDNLNVTFLKGKHPAGEKYEAFRRFMDGDSGVEEDIVINDAEFFTEVTEETNSIGDVQKTRLDSFTMNFSGEINVDMVSNSLRYILSGAKNAKIQIICELE
jgi:hypothetical protein